MNTFTQHRLSRTHTSRCQQLATAAFAALASMLAGVPALHAQVQPVVASSIANIATPGGALAGRVVVDACGDLYINQNGQQNSGIIEIQAGTGKQTVLNVNTNGYNNGQGLAIDAAKANLYFPTTSEWYSSSFNKIPITNCVPGGGAAFATNFGALTGYYYGTAGNIAVDTAGDVFFTPTYPSTGEILEESAAGVASVALASWPNTITSLAVDNANNLYFTDNKTANVYQLKTPYTGAPTTFSSGFTTPSGLSIGPLGNLYISDSGTSLVYEIPLESAALNPADKFVLASVPVTYNVAVDALQNLYLSNAATTAAPPNEVLIGSLLLPSTAVGASSAATPINYYFNAAVTPATIAIKSGSAASVPFTNAGGTGACAAGTAYTAGQSCSVNVKFSPVVVGERTGAIILADSKGNSLNTSFVSGIAQGAAITIDPGNLTALGTGFKTPRGAAVDAQNNLYVADAGTNTVTLFAAGGTTGTTVGTGTFTLSAPAGVAVDAAGDLFISDTGNSRVLEVPVVAGVLAPASTVALTAGLKSPGGLAFDPVGNLYIADTGNNRVVVVPVHGNGLLFSAAVAIGTGLNAPLAVTVDPSGDVFIADSGNGAVQEIVAPATSANQIRVVTGLSTPSGVATDASGSLFVVDQGNTAIYRYPNVAGALGTRALVGSGVANPYGIALDSSGNLYATDATNSLFVELARVQTALQFGGYNVGTTSSAFTATVEDAGNLPLTFPNPSYKATGNTAAGFTVTSDSCGTAGTVQAGATCAISATFTPPVIELNAEEDLNLSSNAVTTAPKIALIGTGAHITPATVSLALTKPASSAGLTVGTSVTFAATIGTGTNTATPGGSVKFFVSGTQVGQAPVSSGVATITLPNGLPAGSAVLITAVYSGDSINYSGATASITESVSALATSLTLTITTPYTNPSSANDSSANATGPVVPLTATLTIPVGSQIIPGGTVTFYAAGSPNRVLGVASIASVAGGLFTATLPNFNLLRAGTTNVVENNSFSTTYTLFAAYTGDSSYSGSSSPTAPVTIVAPPLCAIASPATCTQPTTGAYFTLSPNPLVVTVPHSSTGPSTGSSVLTVTSYGGWAGTLNFTCSGLPAYATCAPYPGAPLVAVSTPNAPLPQTTVQFIINTNQTPTPPTATAILWWVGGAFGLLLLIARRRTGSLARLCTLAGLLLVLGATLAGAGGCSSGTLYTTPTGSSTITVAVHAAQSNPASTNGGTLANDVSIPSFQITLNVQ